MLIIPPPVKYPRKRFRETRAAAAPISAAPVLVAATFDTTDGAVLMLTFDRDVDVSGFSPSAVLVVNEPGESRYDGGAGAFQDGPETVRVEMTQIDVIPVGAQVLLSATGASGIVATDGGAAWSGVTDLELPFP